MQKKRPPKHKESQHGKFVRLARDSGADENEAAFVGKVKKIAKPPSKTKGS